MIICITGTFPIYHGSFKVGEEFVVSHGIDSETGEKVILPSEHPRELGAVFDTKLCEWVILES